MVVCPYLHLAGACYKPIYNSSHLLDIQQGSGINNSSQLQFFFAMASQTAVDTSGDSAVASEAAALLLTGVATAMQGVGMQGGGGGEGNEVEMTGADPNMRQVLSGLQQTESSSVISSVLPAQPQVFTDGEFFYHPHFET